MGETREERLAEAKARAAENKIVPVTLNKKCPLDVRLQMEVINYIDSLHEPLFSAADICHYLIESHGAPKKTYTTGKLKIFPLVCLFLDQMAQEGIVAVIDEQEAYYKLVSFSGEREPEAEVEVEEIKVTEKKKAAKEKDIEHSQLSLF